MLLTIETFVGRFHPLIVHLPIGFLLLAVILSIVSIAEKYRSLRIAVPFSLLTGSIAAALACITGYVLSLSGNYDTDVLDNHMWMGIVTTAVSIIAYLISIKKIPAKLFRHPKTSAVLIALLFISISITGHLGGSLTHGSGYLSAAALWNEQKEKKTITDLNEAFLFADLVQPILDDKCSSCHNASKKKGRLSTEDFESLVKGGKHGPAIKPGDVAGSNLIKRVSLNPRDKKFMPADGKTPLTSEETAMITWWIEKAALNQDIKFAATNPPAELKTIAATLIGINNNTAATGYPAINISAPPVNEEVVGQIRGAGFAVKYLNVNPTLLDITLLSSQKITSVADLLKQLLPVKENILWLNVAGNNVSDNDMNIINEFINLQRLKLNNNPISDIGISRLTALRNLQSINLYNTKVTKDCLASLSKMGNLKTAVVWGTTIKKEDAVSFASGLNVITGNGGAK